ncbi:MAG: UDP-N-acetylmuramoyl-L-alanyl-D-glutamate--2,6-diaminopimelate ligase [Candidatus Omnitrophica bacterium]|jgi:UDP-N-acetylmuramyl-tripeptide synthetase|nr:UDP-N-acetylmuramoyl-L-alanyl-D-glutamate--2,6-diaminopimelate ligase [Candidatus Omnitrophota bacterium]
MELKKILPNQKLNKNISTLPIRNINDDSRRAEPGDAFFILEGKAFDVFSVLKSIEGKVSCFVASHKNKKEVLNCDLQTPVIFVNNIDDVYRKAVDIFYGFNTRDFKFIGVTGTKGKTTTTFLLYHLLRGLKQNVSMLGTIKYIIGKKEYEASHTTPDYLRSRKIFNEIKKENSKYIVMEVSSHGIEQQRVSGIIFSRCVFTNLSREHLDYHKTMNNYFSAKRKFFMQNKKAVSIINKDDKHGLRIIKGLKKVITYGLERKADFMAKNIILDKSGVQFELYHKGKKHRVESAMLGRHNVFNILAAIVTTFSLGFSLDDIIKYVATFKGVEGRLQEISSGIFVDYAHSPDSLKKALSALKDIGYKKIICLFGCGGNRDKGKRKIMGNISGRLADFTFITSDNPRNEDPLDICRQIESGFSDRRYVVIPDRKDAIEKALKIKNNLNSTCLLIAGKGHESYQIIGDRRILFKDSEIVKNYMKTC